MMRRGIALVGLMVLAALFGTFLMLGAGEGISVDMLPSLSSAFMLAGASCLLGGAYSGVVLLRVSDAGSWNKLTTVKSLGILFVVLAPFIPFPISCNLQTWYNPTNVSHGCPADPWGTWSTVWPNVLLLEVGLLFASIGLASAKPDRSPLVGSGMGLAMGGLALIAFEYSFVFYMTSCAANGCLPLTSAQWWSFFWPNVLAKIIGASQVVVGAAVCFIGARRGTPALSEPATIPVANGMGGVVRVEATGDAG
jgi:hypothetical protein